MKFLVATALGLAISFTNTTISVADSPLIIIDNPQPLISVKPITEYVESGVKEEAARAEPTIDPIEEENRIIEKKIKLAQKEMEQVETIEDDYEYYLAYTDVLDRYKDWIDPPETVLDYFTDDELSLLYHVVSAEIGNYSFEQQCNVVSVIYNRLEHERFNCEKLTDVLVASQFATISNGRYKNVTPSQTTIDACNYVFMFGDTADKAVYFESAANHSHDSYAKFVFSDGAHNFYKCKGDI